MTNDAGVPRTAAKGRVSLRAKPEDRSPQVTEALLGERVDVLEDVGNGWARVRTRHDDYEGFARQGSLGPPLAGPTVTVTALRGHLFAGPKYNEPLLDELSLGARLALLDAEPVDTGKYRWWRVAYGGGEAFLQTGLTAPRGDESRLDLARRFLDTPYVWGGRSAWGLDCSGLTQVLYGPGAIPRDADEQEAFLTRVERPAPGDLAFFPGHVGIMLSETEMLHANATHMRVTIETLGEGDYGRRLLADLSGFGHWDGVPYRPQPVPETA